MNRRNFVASIIAAGAGFAVAPSITLTPQIKLDVITWEKSESILIFKEQINIGRVVTPVKYYVAAVYIKEVKVDPNTLKPLEDKVYEQYKI